MTLSKRSIRAAAILALVGQFTAVGAVAPAAFAIVPPMSDKVPADTLFYLSWNGADPALSTSKLVAALRAIKIDEKLDKTIPAIVEANKPGEDLTEYREAVSILRELAARPVAFYFRLPGGPEREPAGGLMVDGGADAEALEAKLTKKMTGNDEHGRIGSIVWLGNGKPTTDGEMLASSAKMKEAMGGIAPGQVLTLYFDLAGVMGMASTQAAGDPGAAKANEVMEALGLKGLKSVYLTGRFDKGDWMLDLFLAAPGERKGIVKHLLEPARAGDRAALMALVPADALSVSSVHFDPNGLVDSAIESLKTSVPDAEQMRVRAMSAATLMTGVRLKEDLFASLAPGWVTYQPADGSVPFVVVNKPRNPELAVKSVDRLVRALARIAVSQQARGIPPATVVAAEVGGTPISTLTVGPVVVSWGMKDGVLAFSSTPDAVSKALVAPSGGGIASSPKVKAAEARLGLPAGALTEYADLARSFPQLYTKMVEQLPVAKSMLEAQKVKGVDLAAWLPPMETIKPLMTESAGGGWSDAAGWHYKSVSPFPGADPSSLSSAGVGTSALAVSILLPSLTRARETANRVKCASNMLQIGTANLLYANKNKGKYANSLADLLRTQDIVADVFLCPGSDSSIPPDARGNVEKAADWVDAHSDYTYVGRGLSISVPADLIVLYEKDGAHNKDGRNVLFADGHVEFVRESDFSALLASRGPDSEMFKAAVKPK